MKQQLQGGDSDAHPHRQPQPRRSCGFDDADDWGPIASGGEGDNDLQLMQQEDDDNDYDGSAAAAESHFMDQVARREANRSTAIRRKFDDKISVEQYDKMARRRAEALARREKRRCAGECGRALHRGGLDDLDWCGSLVDETHTLCLYAEDFPDEEFELP